MIRVLWLTPDKPADISVGRRRLADHLEQHGVDVTLRGTTPRTAWRAFRERHEYDAVIGTTRAGALVGAALRLAGGPPLIVDHVDPIRQFIEQNSLPVGIAVRMLETVSFRVADHVLYVYDEERERVEKNTTSSTQTRLGVEYDRFARPDPEAVAAAVEMLDKYETADRIVIYIGGLERIYHISDLLDAVDRLDEWTLVIAGTGSLKDEVKEASIDSDVIYLGTVPHDIIPGLLHVSDVGISLVDDPHTLKVLEYGAAGLPVVQLEGRAETRFGNKLVYCRPSPEEIAGAVERSVRIDGSSFQACVEQFDWGTIASTYLTVLSEVLGPSKP